MIVLFNGKDITDRCESANLEMSRKPKLQQYFAVSGHCRQAEQWAREHDLSRDNLRHVRDLADLQGPLPDTLYIVGTALRDRNNIEKILDYAREMGWKLNFGNPDGSYF